MEQNKKAIIIENGFYTVVVLFFDTFETTILNEKHFGTLEDAELYKAKFEHDENITAIIKRLA